MRSIAEAITQQDSSGMSFTWIFSRCNTSLTKNEMPKFCRASGFRIGPLPRELAVLNRTEARLVGLGISFTTCFNLYRDQQEFTRETPSTTGMMCAKLYCRSQGRYPSVRWFCCDPRAIKARRLSKSDSMSFAVP